MQSEKGKKFYKMHGTGNAFILILFENETNDELISFAKKICHPKFGVGADGLLIVEKPDENSERRHMKIFSADGSYLEMCGNGLRCFSALLIKLGIEKQSFFEINTDAGSKKVEVTKEDEMNYLVKSSMGMPNKDSYENISEDISDIMNQKIEFAYYMSYGVPMIVIRIDKPKSDNQYIELGRKIQERRNNYVNFLYFENSQSVTCANVTTFEMGGNLALSCGLGVASSFYVLRERKIVSDKCLIKTPGGDMQLSFENENIYVNGPAVLICEGQTSMK